MAEIREILTVQKAELEQKLSENYFERQAGKELYKPGTILIIIGPRRAGKAFFGMHQPGKNRRIAYISFENDQLAKVDDFDEILTSIQLIYTNPDLLLLDEIQNLIGWEVIVSRLYEKGFQLVVTGSNLNLLHTDTITRLSVPYQSIHLYTLNFYEFIGIFDKEFTEAEKIEKFNDFLIHGGYPEPLLKGFDNKEFLKVLIDSILFKDIIKRYQVRRPDSLEKLASWLILNITSEFSMNFLSRHLLIPSVHTVKKYLDYLEDSFMFFSLTRYTNKIGEQQRSDRKIYCFDNGFYRAKALQSFDNRDSLLKNAVASELIRRCRQEGTNLFYWKERGQDEVDFVIVSGRRVTELIQVCLHPVQPDLLKKIIRPLLNASRKLKCKELKVITLNLELTEEYNWFGSNREVKFVAAWKWMLKDKNITNQVDS